MDRAGREQGRQAATQDCVELPRPWAEEAASWGGGGG